MSETSPLQPTQRDVKAIQEIIDISLAIDEDDLLRKIATMRRIVQFLFAPTLVGADRIPAGPVLFVANHSTMAADVLVAMPLLTDASGRAIRGMSDEIMYRYPKARRHIVAAGAVMGNQAIGDALFEAGKDVLDQVPPIPKGLFGTMIPKPKRAYLAVGEPIDTLPYRGTEPSLKIQRALRDQTRERLGQCIDDMLRLQAQERDKTSMLRKLLTM